MESLTAVSSTAEFANIEAIEAEAAKVTNEKEVINGHIFHETGLESKITTTSSSISQSYNEISQFTTTTKDSSGFTEIHRNKETSFEENEKTNQREEIVTIQAETQSISQISQVETFEERITTVVDVHEAINLEDKCEDRTEMSENLSTTSSVSQLHDKNKELCHEELDHCEIDGTKDKDISNGSKVELREADKDDTHEDISTEENDKKAEETAENEKKQHINEGKLVKVGKKNKTESGDLFYQSDSLISLFNVLAETEERNDPPQSKNNFEEAAETDETVIEANESPVEVKVLIILVDNMKYC